MLNKRLAKEKVKDNHRGAPKDQEGKDVDKMVHLTLGLLTGELAVSSKESSTEIILVLVFLKFSLFGIFRLLWTFFHAAQEAASETKDVLSKLEEELCSL